MLKEDILKTLSGARERYLSGQELAKTFGVSRSAVWKAVKALQADGVEIEAVTNKGYRLKPDALTRFDIVLPEGVELYFYDSIDSTNTQAKRLLAEGLSGNALITANEQTAGRVRQGRSFYSPKNTGIYYSYVFHPQKTLADAVFITTAAAVSVIRAIERLSAVKPTIKWVNDVYVEGKKICGILTEAVSDFESGTLESVIVGIGINVSTASFPEELRDTAASLGDASITRAQLLNTAVEELVRVAEDLENPAIMEDYKRHSAVIGKKITFMKNGTTTKAVAIDIDEKGGLVVKTEQGTLTLSSGEITVRL